MNLNGLGGGLALLLLSPVVSTVAQEFVPQRAAMVEEIIADVRRTSEWLGKESLDDRVLQALRKVPRHEFVPPDLVPYAYINRPLPIGDGQTISQPYIVAVMTDLLALKPDDIVFELGTGSGYQAAVLAELTGRVYTMEIVEPLAEQAQRTLKRLGYGNVEVRAGDAYHGWPEKAPFDAIIVTAGGDHIPPLLVQQLKPGGRIVIPVGDSSLAQELMVVEKDQEGGIRTRKVLPVRFVPITGGH
jgi:protein-L-isoaspartate(D-aspartate) O-methyltransferase